MTGFFSPSIHRPAAHPSQPWHHHPQHQTLHRRGHRDHRGARAFGLTEKPAKPGYQTGPVNIEKTMENGGLLGFKP